MALGGMTVEELDSRMTSWELRGWQLFEAKYGPLHPSVRMESAIARAVMPFIKNAKSEYFMPWPKDGDEPSGSLEDAFKILKVAKSTGDKKKRRKKRQRGGRVVKRGRDNGKS